MTSRSTPQRATYTLCIVPTVIWDTPDPVSGSAIALVGELDCLFDRLADRDDQSLKTLLLDGQTSLLETYLTLRPERYDQLETLLQDGSLMLGPWYVQPQSWERYGGIESLIRNLSIGTRTMQAFGVSTNIAYISRLKRVLPHLGQILRGFQIETAILPPSEVILSGERPDTLEYMEQQPDGSRLLVVHLRDFIRKLETTAAEVVDAIDMVRASSAPYSAASALLIPYPVLVEGISPYNTTDILPEALLAVYDRWHDHARQTTLAEYAASVLPLVAHLPSIAPINLPENELLLINDIIGSNEVQMLVEWLEPLTAWAEALPPAPDQAIMRSPQRAIEQIWRQVLRSQRGSDLWFLRESAFVQLIDWALRTIAASIDTSAVTTDADEAVYVVFTRDGGSIRYEAQKDFPEDKINQRVTAIYPQGGTLPPKGRLLEASTPNFKITAIKLPDDQARNGIIVRGYNTSADSELITLTLWRRWETTEVLNLDESAIGGKLAVSAEGGIHFRAAPDRLLTFWFHD